MWLETTKRESFPKIEKEKNVGVIDHEGSPVTIEATLKCFVDTYLSASLLARLGNVGIHKSTSIPHVSFDTGMVTNQILLNQINTGLRGHLTNNQHAS